MKLGILNATTPADEALFQMLEMRSFQSFFAQVPHQLTLIEYRITEGDFPATVTACDAYLVTGSPQVTRSRGLARWPTFCATVMPPARSWWASVLVIRCWLIPWVVMPKRQQGGGAWACTALPSTPRPAG